MLAVEDSFTKCDNCGTTYAFGVWRAGSASPLESRTRTLVAVLLEANEVPQEQSTRKRGQTAVSLGGGRYELGGFLELIIAIIREC